MNPVDLSQDRQPGFMHLGLAASEEDALKIAKKTFSEDEWANVSVELADLEISCGWYKTKEEFEAAFEAEIAQGWLHPHYVNNHWVGMAEFWRVSAEEIE